MNVKEKKPHTAAENNLFSVRKTDAGGTSFSVSAASAVRVLSFARAKQSIRPSDRPPQPGRERGNLYVHLEKRARFSAGLLRQSTKGNDARFGLLAAKFAVTAICHRGRLIRTPSLVYLLHMCDLLNAGEHCAMSVQTDESRLAH